MSPSGRRFFDVVLVLSALATTAAVVSRASWFDGSDRDETRGFEGWEEEFELNRRIGPADAPYRLVVWMDYRCPACRRFEEELGRARERLKDGLAVVYRHYPLDIHPLARRAAVAAECAHEQGQFGAMHRALLEVPLDVDSLPLASLASDSELARPESWRKCISDSTSTAVEAVEADLDHGRELGLRGTPGVQIGDRLATGGMRAEELLSRLRSARY